MSGLATFSFGSLEYSIKRFRVDVYPLGLLDVLEVIVKILPHVELTKFLVNVPYLLQNTTKLLRLDLFFLLVRVQTNQSLVLFHVLLNFCI